MATKLSKEEKDKLFVNLSDTVLVSDLLYYVRNKLKSTPVKIVATTCHLFYTDDEYIFKEKKKLCDLTDEFCNQRRTDDKRLKNIEDIIAIISRRDANNEYLPQFASFDLNNVPVNDNGNPSLGQIMASLYDLRRKVVTKDALQVSLNELKKEFASAPSSVASSCFPSAPLLPHSPLAPLLPLSPSAPLLSLSPSAPNPSVAMESDPTESGVFVAPHSPPPIPYSAATAAGRQRSSGSASGTASTSGQRSFAPIKTGGPKRQPRPEERRNKSRQRDFSRPRTIIGKSVNDGLFSVKGADLTVNRYVGRWHNDTTIDGVKEFITKQNVSVVELVDLETKHERFKSFRLRIKKTQLPLIEDENFWPAGVILSPFFRGKDEKQTGTGAASAASTNG